MPGHKLIQLSRPILVHLLQATTSKPRTTFTANIRVLSMAEPDDQETCPLCPPSGPPAYSPKQDPHPPDSSSGAPGDDTDDDISWISCSKCSTWYHDVCILLSGDDHKSTVPVPVLAYVAEQPRAEWTDWTGWVGRW